MRKIHPANVVLFHNMISNIMSAARSAADITEEVRDSAGPEYMAAEAAAKSAEEAGVAFCDALQRGSRTAMEAAAEAAEDAQMSASLWAEDARTYARTGNRPPSNERALRERGFLS